MNTRNTISVIIVIAIMAVFGGFVSPVSATDYLFFDDMENPESGNWTLEGTWGYTEIFFSSPTHSLTDSPDGNYANNANISATLSSALNLTAAVKPVLTFWQRYALETDKDYGHIEVSKDGGSTWKRLAFVTGQQPDWVQMKIDLSEYAGTMDVVIRFRLTSNSSVTYDGWYIDDVSVEETAVSILYPFFDDMEDPSGSEANWLSSSWEIGTPGVDSSSYCWSSTGYDYTWNSLTPANVLDLTSAKQPQLTFWHKYSGSHFYVEVSDSNGHEGTWQRMATYSGTQNDWVQAQIDLSDYQGLPNVRIRFVNNGYHGSYWWQIDDIRVEDTPWPHGIMHQPTGVTMHSAHLSWEQYPWGIGPLFADFDRYEIYRAKSDTVSRSNGELVCQIFNPAVTEYDDTCDDPAYVILQPDYYWYRMYVVDVNGMYSTGSIAVQAIYQIPIVGYPFFDDMESGTGNWEWGCPWGLTDLFSHSGSYAWTDSPDGNYPNNANTALTTRLNLSIAVKPVLTFWQRYALETDKDYGHIEVSKDGGSTWKRLAFVTGQQPDWVQMKIDLSEYAGTMDVVIRFRLTSNSSVTYDGWYIDDVSVEETAVSILYPFFDDMEDPSGSEANWLSSSWEIGTPGVDSSSYCWSSTGYDYTWNSLTPANVLDLTSAKQPQLTFWHKYSGSHFYVEVSDSNGHEGTWQRMATYSGTQNDWVQAQIDLSDYQGLPNVRIRFVNNGYHGSYWWQIDDIRVEDTPWPHGIMHQPTGVTMHSAHLSWEQYPWGIGPLFADFDRYEIYRAKSDTVSRSNGELVCQIFNPAVTEYDDTCDDPAYVILQPDYYWYRMYVVDVNGMYSTGSIAVQAIYQIPIVGYPFFDDMESGTGNWEWGCPWGLTDLFSHSGSYAWTDSPDGNYPNNANTALTTRLNLSIAVKPVLTFWQRYALETDKDYGHIEVSKDGGSTWKRLAFVTGQQPDWVQMKIDLSEYAGTMDVVIRFRLTSNSSVTYDGWYIDDVSVEETAVSILYPFFDDMEDPSGSEANWLSSSWEIGTPGVDSSSYCWSSTGYDYTWNSLTPANVLDLTSAKQPQLTFWHKYSGSHFYVEVSDSNGHEGTWQRMATYSGTQNDWVQAQIDLSDYQGLPNVRIRFVNNGYHGSYWWQIDDIRVKGIEPPGPVPDVKANGYDGPLFITPDEPVNITAALNPGDEEGVTCDWWIGALTPFRTYWLDRSLNWVPSSSPISVAQCGLFDLLETSLLDIPLPEGIYTFFFVLDNTPDGIFGVTWYDYVNVICQLEGLDMKALPDFEAIFKEKMKDLMGQ